MVTDLSNPFYTGEFRHGLDPKNRITIPSAWRTGEAEGFYARIDSTGSCIVIYPPGEFQKTLASIEALPNTSQRERMQFIRQFSAETLPCSLDKQGRMVLPPDFCTRIGLNGPKSPKGEVILVGNYGRFEIWHPERWADTKEAEAPTFHNLANQLGL